MGHPAFEVHKVNGAGWHNAQRIAGAFNALVEQLTPMTSASPREHAIVMTKLEEACFFAKKAMASQPANQDGRPTDAEGRPYERCTASDCASEGAAP